MVGLPGLLLSTSALALGAGTAHAAATTTYLSDVVATTAVNGWGPVERNASNGESAAGDGRGIRIAGRAFAKGLGVHAASDVRFAVPTGCSEFRAHVGVDDEVGRAGTVAFRVLLDGRTAWTSPTRKGGEAALEAVVPLGSAKQLALVVTNAGDGGVKDHADWADARLLCTSVTPTPSTTPATPAPAAGVLPLTEVAAKSATNGWGPAERDRSNGEDAAGDGRQISIGGVGALRGLGVHAPSDVRYTVPATCTRLRATVGVDDEVGAGGSVSFSVLVDGREVWASDTRRGGQAGVALDVPVAAGGELALVVKDAWDGTVRDHGDWADPTLLCGSVTATPSAQPSAAPTTAPAAPVPAPTASPTPTASPSPTASATPVATPLPTEPTTPTPTAPTAKRDLFLQPFSSTSIWNLPIATGATFESATGTRTASLLAGDPVTWLNQGTYSHPVARATESDPLAVVTDYNDARRSAQYRIPASAQIATGTDRHLHVVAPDGRTIHEAWDMTRQSSTGYRVGRHETVDLAGSGMGPSNGTRAYGGSAVGGLVRAWEVDPGHPAYTGVIRHPIAMALRDDQLYYSGGNHGYDAAGYGTSKGYVWPATEQDANAGWAYSGKVPMGTYFAIPSSVDLTTLGLTKEGMMLARAYQDYGGYVTDRAGATILAYVEPSAPSTFGSTLLGPSWSAADLRKIRQQLRAVTNNTAATPNGGTLAAPRRAPLLP